MTYFFETYGCQMNFAESASTENLLKNRGWHAAKSLESADLILINTCSVSITAETRIFGRLGYFSTLKKQTSFTLIIMGCMAERLRNSIKKDFPVVDFIIGTFDRPHFSKIFAHIEAQLLQEENNFFSPPDIQFQKTPQKYIFSPSSYKEDSFQSFVPIMNGCNNFCTYCIVPHVRGREISRSVQDILTEVHLLAEKNVREITLLGQNVNSYNGVDKTGNPIQFPQLLRLIARACDKKDCIRRIHFISSHPKDMSDELIRVIAEEPRVCKLIHLPVQHGSSKILKKMNRRYTRETYIDLVHRIRKHIPNAEISTDIMVGFPGETEDDIEQTLSLMKEIRFYAAFMYHFNPREGTPAFSYENQIPEPLRLARLKRVISLQMKIVKEKMHARLGTNCEMLVESHSRNNHDELFGHTELGEMVVLIGKNNPNLIGQFVKITLQSLKGKTFRAVRA